MIDLSDKPEEFLYFYDCVKSRKSLFTKLKLMSFATIGLCYSEGVERIFLDGRVYFFQFDLELSRDDFLMNCRTLDSFLEHINKKIIAANDLFKKTTGEW